jgi:hypothetical protein
VIRRAFGTAPTLTTGSYFDARAFMREKSIELGLPTIEYPFICSKPSDFEARGFESPGIYLTQDLYDEFDKHELRVGGNRT